jgi:hypothetical protein
MPEQTPNRKMIVLTDLFTEKEIDDSFKIIADHWTVLPHAQHGRDQVPALTDVLVEKIVDPVLCRINEKTGQQNDARYLAYVLQYAYLKTQEKRRDRQP